VPKVAPSPPEVWEVSLTDGQSIDTVLRMIFEKGLQLRHLVEKKHTLEDAFLATVEAAEPGVDRKPTGKATAVGGSDR
jgi:ABC-2 type transport system ATP-binding protein